MEIGDVLCKITSATEALILCAAGENSVGTYKFIVSVIGKGLARMNSKTTATFQLKATEFTPALGSTGGANILTINGSGFSQNTSVIIDNNKCKILRTDYNSIQCIVPQNVKN